MNKKALIVIVASLGVLSASAQTLFTYGKYSVDAKEFLRAYNKNNTQPVVNRAKSIKDYLDLYVNSRVKIREAYDRRYDTLFQIKAEVENLRNQISENYMNDPALVERLKIEAFNRSLKDVEVAHIFISFKNASGLVDSAAAKTKRDQALQHLKNGEDFAKVAQLFSDDPAVKTNHGNLGYITLFTLPYEFESAIYNTPVGKYSSPVTSKIGYHIFKNVGERKALGKIKAQQILLAIPPGADEATQKKIARLADSLYKRIMAGDAFGPLATVYSNDYITAVNGGIMPEIGVGHYEPAFEKVLWSLPKDGAVSKPFLTSHGWHIIKRISVKPIETDINNKANIQDLQTKVMTDKRWKLSKEFIYNRVRNKAGVKNYEYNDNALHAYTDSLLDRMLMTEAGKTIKPNTPLFSIGDSIYDASDWIEYSRTYRYNQDGSGIKPYPQVKQEFLESSMYDYYKNHLEDFNDEFRNQMAEFKDGNIFFEIMQQEIWNKAQTDTVALMALYEKNKSHYMWDKSADAILFFCSDENTAKKMYEDIKKKPSNWRKITENYSEKVVADSSRYEWNQIPNLQKAIPKAGMITMPLVNQSDNTASFAYVIQAYSQPVQRTFNEARGLVINDYQAILEKEWTDQLKKKYPVVIDQKVLAEISK